MSRNLYRRQFVAGLGVCVGLLPVNLRAADTYTLRLGVPQPSTSVLARTGLRLASNVDRRTNGQVKIEVYPNGQLAPQQATIDALVNGVIDFAVQAATFLELLLPRFQVLAMPFMFRTTDIGHRVIDGPIGRELLSELEPKGIIGYGWTGSFREVWTASRVVSAPEDMKGLRTRIPGGSVTAATYQTLGALPVTIDQSEIMSALQQHVIEGIDTNVDSFTTEKYYIGAKRANMLNHIFAVNMMMGSKKKISALPEQIQRIIMEEGRAAQPFWRTLIAKQTAEDIDILKKNGVGFTDTPYAPFRKAVEPVYAQFQPRFGELLERVARAAGSA